MINDNAKFDRIKEKAIIGLAAIEELLIAVNEERASEEQKEFVTGKLSSLIHKAWHDNMTVRSNQSSRKAAAERENAEAVMEEILGEWLSGGKISFKSTYEPNEGWDTFDPTNYAEPLTEEEIEEIKREMYYEEGEVTVEFAPMESQAGAQVVVKFTDGSNHRSNEMDLYVKFGDEEIHIGEASDVLPENIVDIIEENGGIGYQGRDYREYSI